MSDLISRQAAIDALWKALYAYENKTEKQFIESDELDINDWIQHRIFIQNMSEIDRQTIQNLPTIEAVPLEDYRSMEQTVHKLTQAIAEAEPVKHGHWIVISEYPKKAECSHCGYPIEHELVCWWDYCPNCGARMDEVEE